MSVLSPKLTPLDELVIEAVTATPQRATAIADLLFGDQWLRCTVCDDIVPGQSHRSNARWLTSRRYHCALCWQQRGVMPNRRTKVPVLVASPKERATVREILRGLERCGVVRQAGGWWKRA